MSRFKPSPSAQAIAPVVTGPQVPERTGYAPPLPSAAAAPAVEPRDRDTLGFICLCLYMISAPLNDWSFKLLGNKAYVSVVMLIATPAMYVISRNRFRALRDPMGRWWTGFLILMLLDTPFSVWRGGTVSLLINYLPRSYVLFFFLTAFLTSIRRCRRFIMINITCAAFLLLSCMMFGESDQDGRFRIANSIFTSNSNDLALLLLINITQIAYLLRGGGMIKKAFAIVMIALSVMYVLRTGSRGCLITGLAYALLVFYFSRNKVVMVAVALLSLTIGILMNPSAPFKRFTTFNDVSTAAGSSTMQRKELFVRSLYETATHPLFGVGPGQFAAAVSGESERKGEHSPWLGTHNSYTQVSAECGIPALVCYCAVIFLCFRYNYRMFAATQGNPEYTEVANLSFTLMSGILVYALATFFFHMAYTGNLPILAGLTLALYFSVDPHIRAVMASRKTGGLAALRS